MIASLTTHLVSQSPQRRANEPVVGELLDRNSADAPSPRHLRTVTATELASHGRPSHVEIDRRTRHAYTSPVAAGRSARRVTVTNVRQLRVTIARATRAAAVLGVFGSGRMCFGALDLYLTPYRGVEAGAIRPT